MVLRVVVVMGTIGFNTRTRSAGIPCKSFIGQIRDGFSMDLGLISSRETLSE